LFFRNCINTYNKALVETSSAAFQRRLWDLFLDDVIGIYNSSDKKDQTDKDLVIKLVDHTFYQAFSSNFMKKPKHFIFWVIFYCNLIFVLK